MHPPKPPNIVQQLNGKIVDTVTFAKYTIHLTFDSIDSISFSAPFQFGAAATIQQSEVSDFPLEKSDVMRIVGASLTSVDCTQDGTLLLYSSNADALIEYSLEGYEAYTLRIDGTEYYV